MGSVTNLEWAGARDQVRELRAVQGEGRADREAEEAVLCAILLDEWGERRVYERVTAIVSPEDFADPRACAVFEAMVRLRGRGESVDARAIGAELIAMARLNTVGGAQYIADLFDAVTTTAHCETHARIVLEHSAARTIAEKARRLATLVMRPGADLARALAEHQEALRAVRLPGSGIGLISDDLNGMWIEAENRAEDPRGGRLSTGVVDLDDALGGGYGPGYHIIAARPSLGKTALATQMCRFQVTRRSPRPVAFFQLEMGRRAMLRTQIAALARVPYDRVQNPSTLSRDHMTACVAASQAISAWPWYLTTRDDPRLPRTVADIRRAVLALPEQPAMVVIDHVKKLQPRGRHLQSRDAMKEIGDDLVGLARELAVPVIVLAHIGRAVAKDGVLARRPRMEDLSESGSLEEDADSVTLLHSEAAYPTKKYDKGDEPDPSLTDVQVAKIRGSKRGIKLKLRFRGEFQTFESTEGSDRFLWSTTSEPAPTPEPEPAPASDDRDIEFDFGGDHG